MHRALGGGPEGTSLLVATEGDHRFEFDAPCTIGRHPANDLVLEHPRISNRHASLEWDGTGWLLSDLGSRNGTSVDRRRLKGPKRLRVGARIRFGGASGWVVDRLAPARSGGRYAPTERDLDGEAPADLHVHLAFTESDGGQIHLLRGEERWTVTMRQRFVLLHLLGRAGGDWVDDEDLRIGLWGRSGSAEVDRSALHKLIFDVRRLLEEPAGGVNIIHKARGRTRLALPAERIHLEAPARAHPPATRQDTTG